MSRLDKNTLSRMSDEELRDELERRRKARARGRRSSGRDLDAKQIAQVMRWYANLELDPGASREQIEEAYRRLMKKYHPSRHRDDPKKRAAAEELSDSLTKAYQGLLKHKEAQAKRRRR